MNKVTQILIAAFCSFLSSSALPAAEINELVEAHAHFRKGSALFINAEMSGLNYGLLTYGLDEEAKNAIETAIKHFQKCVDLNPNHPEAFVFLANAYWSLNQMQLASESFIKALEVSPWRDDVLSARAAAFIEQEKFDEAANDLARLEEIGSEFAESIRTELYEAKDG